MPDRFDVFVSYAEPDRWWVEGFLLDALEQARVRYHSEAAFRLGVPRIDEFERAVRQSNRTVLVLSPAFLVDNSAQLFRRLAQQYGIDSQTWPVIPLLLKPVPKLDPSLRILTGLDATTESYWPDVIRRLCQELQRPVPQVSLRPACPFPGMRAFRSSESGAFFGREPETRSLVDFHLRLHPFVAIIGASGTGKSSLAFAGLVPELERSPSFGSGGWLVKSLRPGPRPLETLRGVIGDHADPDTCAARLLEAVRNGPQPDAERLLLIVDQFEELFSLAADTLEADRAEFADALLRFSRAESCYVVLTIRADFYSDLMRNPALWEEVRSHRLELTPLTHDGLRAAIVRPAEAADVQIEPSLVERLLGDAGTEPGILPFLQETLVLLWGRLKRRCLPASAYDALVIEARRMAPDSHRAFRSGLEVAMASRADQTMSSLASDEARSIARRILLRLVQFGEGRVDTRRQQKIAELRSADDDPVFFQSTLKRLIDARLLTTSGEESRSVDDTPVDIAHEALLTGWPSLADWIALRRDAEQTRRWLRQLSEKWLQRCREGQEGGLLDEVELHEAERWQERYGALVGSDTEIGSLIAESRGYIEQTRREREEQRRRELEQQTRLAEEQRMRAEDAERFAREQSQLNAELQILNRELRRAAANNSFVQSARLLEAGRGDRAMARLAQTLSLDAGHAAAEFAMYALLTRRWHPRRLGVCRVGDKVTDALYSPDGRWLVSCGGTTTHRWRLDGDSTPAALRHASQVQSLRISSDSRRLLTASTTFGEAFGKDAHVAEGTVELWEFETGNRIASARVHGMVTAAIFGAGEKRVYVASAFGPVALTEALEPAADPWPHAVDRSVYTLDNTYSLIAYHEGAKRIAWIGSPHLVGGGDLFLWDEATSQLLSQSEQPGFNEFVFGPGGTSAVFSGPLLPNAMRGIGERHRGFAGVMDLDPPSFRPSILQHEDEVACLRLNAAATRAVTGSFDNSAALWAPLSSAVIARLSHDSSVTAAAFSPSGNLLVTGTHGGAARIWDGYTGEALSEIVWHDGEIASIAFNPAGTEFLVALASGAIYRYDAASTVALQMVLETGKPRMVLASFLPEPGAHLLVRSEDRFEVWDALAGEPRYEFLTGNTDATIGAVSPERGLLAVIDGNRVRVFDLAGGNEIVPAISPGSEIVDASFGPGGRLVVVSQAAVTLAAAGAAPQVLDIQGETVVAARELRDGKLLVAAFGGLRLVDLASGAVLDELPHDVAKMQNTFDGESDSFVIKLSPLSIVDVLVDEDANRLLVLYGHSGAYVGQPRYKDRYVVEDAQLWTLAPLRPLAPPMGGEDPAQKPEYPLNNAAYLPQSKRIATTSNDGAVRIWSSETGALLHGPIPHLSANFWAVPSPEQRMVAVYGRSKEVNLWNVETGEPVGRPLTHDAPVKQIRFAGETSVLITWAENGAVRAWDCTTGLPLGDEIATGPGIRSVDVSPSGDIIVTVNDPGVASLHRIGQAELFRESLGHLLPFAESVCGWTVSQQGIEIRRRGAFEPSGEAGAGWTAFQDWFAAAPPSKSCFPGTSLSANAVFADLLSMGPSPLAWMVLQHDPANPEALMCLAEAVADNAPEHIRVLAHLVAASNLDELQSAAQGWADLAVLLAGGAPGYKQRRKALARAFQAGA